MRVNESRGGRRERRRYVSMKHNTMEAMSKGKGYRKQVVGEEGVNSGSNTAKKREER